MYETVYDWKVLYYLCNVIIVEIKLCVVKCFIILTALNKILTPNSYITVLDFRLYARAVSNISRHIVRRANAHGATRPKFGA